ncbi:type VI secretion system Vgr family protein [Burkholderia ubonensis]|uniref:type VI secretion system Vgr family protein n=1 Tax=Burkholderia ubonensis TaxID=101571 RepID=UPI00075DDA59|nr:type VI secretion system Vgr family protein [Burkholderia ubonensis]KVV11971.1 type VI secretion protein Vgr [Burkholderia ubonensis]KVZ39319.1 type VI secretion protein Vgr [Burkholderia ubonensis]
MSMILPSQAYELKLAPHPAPFSILKFTGLDQVSQLYRHEIEFTSPAAGIPMDQVLGRPAKFIVDPIDPNMDYLRKMFGENAAQFSKKPPAYTVHGIITKFDEFETSADETRYRVVLEPKLADLDRGVTSRLFQKQSVDEIVTDTLRHYGYRAGVDFVFQLRGQYKRREYVTQYHETTFAFIQRICAEEGIWFRWEQKKDRAVVVFGDDLDAYARKQRAVPYRRDSGLESAGADAIKTLGRETRRVPESVRLHDYNHRLAGVSLLVEENAAREDKTTNAVDYRWGEHYETPEEGKRVARLRHEAYLASQITFKGTGNPFWLEAGEVMRVDPKPADAKHGIFITSVESHGGRNESYWVSFEGIPSDRVWRTHIASIQRPSIEGILPARITSPGDYKYAYLTEQGWYVIVLPFDLDRWSPGGTSRPVRFAKPYSGDNYGHHFPLIDGAEVALVFTQGNPDRPVIIGAMHDSLHPDLVNNLNHTRNLIRTAAKNEMRMEDKEGVEHIHLTTPNQTSELNLGHMVDEARGERGQGAELRTDGHLAARGPKGMLLTTEAQPGASGRQLDMAGAQAQLQRAIDRMESLSEAVRAAEATVAELKQQKAFYAEALDGLKRAAILMSAPSGIGLTSGEHLQVNADRNLIATAGGNFDVGIMRNFTVAAGRQVSLFAQAHGVRVTAAKQDVVVQARTGAMALSSSKDMHFTSTDGSILATSRGALTLTSGGAYLKIDGGNIELGCPGNITLKCGNFHWTGPGNLSVPLPAMPIGPCKECFMDAHRGVEAMTEVA